MIPTRSLGERIASMRKSEGLTQAQVASRLGVSRTTVVAMEKGSRRPTNEELVELSGILGVSAHELLRKGPARPEVAPRFRLSPKSKVANRAVEEAVQCLVKLGQNFVELERTLEIQRSETALEGINMYRTGSPGRLGDPALAGENAALAVRRALGLGDSPALMLDELFEIEGGLRIFYLDEIPSAVAGIFVWGEALGGCIGINRRHPHERRRWSLVHEVGHFLRDREAGDVLPTAGHPRRDPSEIFSETFTQEFLLPRTGVTKQFTDRCRSNGGSFSVADVLWLAKLNEVSFQAMTLRLEGLGLLPSGTYERLTARKFKPEEARRELGFRTEAERPRPPRFPARYISLAIEAYEQELISEGELADYLQTDRVSARHVYQERRRRELDDGFEIELDLAERILKPA